MGVDDFRADYADDFLADYAEDFRADYAEDFRGWTQIGFYFFCEICEKYDCLPDILYIPETEKWYCHYL